MLIRSPVSPLAILVNIRTSIGLAPVHPGGCLIARLRDRWDHNCVVDQETLGLLFGRQSAALHTLRLNRQADTWSESSLIPDGLRELRLGSLKSRVDNYGLVLDKYWQTILVARNCKTLRHLELGFETDAAEDFFGEPIGDNDRVDYEQTMVFARTLREECKSLNASMSLLSLKLISCDIDVLLKSKYWPTIDLRNLTHLVLEECFSEPQAFPLLSSISTNPEDTRCLLSITSFTFRQKYMEEDDGQSQLRDFICALPRGLQDLSVLVDNVHKSIGLRSILRVHGKTLKTLIWDERTYGLQGVQSCTAVFPKKHGVGYLPTISNACPNLRELGVAMDWTRIRALNGAETKVFLSQLIVYLRPYLLIPDSYLSV